MKADKAGGCYGENHSFKKHGPVITVGTCGQLGGKAPTLHHDPPMNVMPGGEIKPVNGQAGGYEGKNRS